MKAIHGDVNIHHAKHLNISKLPTNLIHYEENCSTSAQRHKNTTNVFCPFGSIRPMGDEFEVVHALVNLFHCNLLKAMRGKCLAGE